MSDGVKFSRNAAQRIVSAVKHVEDMVPRFVGQAGRAQRKTTPECVVGTNQTLAGFSEGDCVKIIHLKERICSIELVTDPDDLNFGICAMDISSGGSGNVFLTGSREIKVSSTTYGNPITSNFFQPVAASVLVEAGEKPLLLYYQKSDRTNRIWAEILRTGEGDGGTGTPGEFNIPTVETLPAIPTELETAEFVFWTSAGAGTGDDQIWAAYVGQTEWYPQQKLTNKSGVPL